MLNVGITILLVVVGSAGILFFLGFIFFFCRRMEKAVSKVSVAASSPKFAVGDMVKLSQLWFSERLNMGANFCIPSSSAFAHYYNAFHDYVAVIMEAQLLKPYYHRCHYVVYWLNAKNEIMHTLLHEDHLELL